MQTCFFNYGEVMKTVSGSLITLMAASSQFYVAEVYTLTLASGTPYYYTSFDSDVVWNGHTFTSGSLLLQRSKISQVCGMEVDELEIDAYPVTATIGGIGFLAAVNNGALDGATIKLERIFYPAFGQTATGAYTLFQGIVSDIEIGRTYARIKVQSSLELLQIPWPPFVYQPGCVWQLYGSGCGLNKAAFTAGGTVAAGTLGVSAFTSNINRPDNYYDMGVITFGSGVNTGVTRTIKSYTNSGGLISVVLPLPAIPAISDTFDIYPGCDRQLTTCTSKFSNQAKYNGMPYIPVPEMMY